MRNGWQHDDGSGKFERPLAPPDAFEAIPQIFKELVMEQLKDLFNNPKSYTIALLVVLVLCVLVRYGAPTVGVTLPDNVNDMLDKTALFCFGAAGLSAVTKNVMQGKVDTANAAVERLGNELGKVHALENERLRSYSAPKEIKQVLTTDATEARNSGTRADGQQEKYVVLPDTERKEFVRPVRQSYKHLKCGTVTTMGLALAETYATNPSFYSGTFCAGCHSHFPVGADGEFVWIDDETKVGT